MLIIINGFDDDVNNNETICLIFEFRNLFSNDMLNIILHSAVIL